MSIFLTDPDNLETEKVDRKIKKCPFDYKEAVCARLQEMDIPLRKAELAVIDMKSYVINGFHNKDSAMTTAFKMLPEVKRIYMS